MSAIHIVIATAAALFSAAIAYDFYQMENGALRRILISLFCVNAIGFGFVAVNWFTEDVLGDHLLPHPYHCAITTVVIVAEVFVLWRLFRYIHKA
jgi:hypothetical protein